MTNLAPRGRSRSPVYATRRLDLAEIDAVGFDLDHTLAVYDDHAVNKLACDEARGYLVQAGHPSTVTAAPFDNQRTPRGLAIALETGHIVKLDTRERISRALLGASWLSADEVEALNARTPHRFHHLNSPFDVPTGFMFSELLSLAARGVMDFSEICADVRGALDRAHTRGNLKRTILSDVGRFVSPLPGFCGAVERFRHAGKRVFVATNSEHSYTVAILDYLLPDWPRLIDVVRVSTNKPVFFTGAQCGRILVDTPTRIVSGGTAVELESELGVSGDRVLFVGDNPVADVEAASTFGWKTVQVLTELNTELGANNDGHWGSMLWEAGQGTRFARSVFDHADLYTEHIDALFNVAPDQRLDPGPGLLGGWS